MKQRDKFRVNNGIECGNRIAVIVLVLLAIVITLALGFGIYLAIEHSTQWLSLR